MSPCSEHKFTFKHTIAKLSIPASKGKRCSCQSSTHKHHGKSSPFIQGQKEQSGKRTLGGDNRKKRVLWVYEMDNLVIAYKWLMQTRSRRYTKCSDAMIVYQLLQLQIPTSCWSLAFWYYLPGLGCHQPTPFSCKIIGQSATCLSEDFKKSLLEWTLGNHGTDCMGIAVQHTLYYHAKDMRYKMMVTHTVTDSDTTLNIFRL